MKSCFYCGGRKVDYIRNTDLSITMKCKKCGAAIMTPNLTIDSARGCWNTKMAELERSARKKEAAAG